MPDFIDDAQRIEAFALEAALSNAHAARGPQAVVIDGVVCCSNPDCGEPIPQARLKALPGVGLCVACAEEKDAVG